MGILRDAVGSRGFGGGSVGGAGGRLGAGGDWGRDNAPTSVLCPEFPQVLALTAVGTPGWGGATFPRGPAIPTSMGAIPATEEAATPVLPERVPASGLWLFLAHAPMIPELSQPVRPGG